MGKRIKYILAPICIIKLHCLEFVLWLTFVVISGQLGTLINIVNRCVFGKMSVSQSIMADSLSGSFYTFSLVLMASLVGTLFIKLLRPTEPEHRLLMVPFVAISFMLMLFCAVFYSCQTNGLGAEYTNTNVSDIHDIDWWQSVFFLASVFFALYAFGLERLHQHHEYDEMATYKDNEERSVEELREKKTEINTGGLKL